jgi:predicted RNase H-like nuclease
VPAASVEKDRGGPCAPPAVADRCGVCDWGVERRPLKGAGRDDLLDAIACAAIARRIHAGLARPFPDPPERDALGLPMAIWA